MSPFHSIHLCKSDCYCIVPSIPVYTIVRLESKLMRSMQVWEIHSTQAVEPKRESEYRYSEHRSPWFRWTKDVSCNSNVMNGYIFRNILGRLDSNKEEPF